MSHSSKLLKLRRRYGYSKSYNWSMKSMGGRWDLQLMSQVGAVLWDFNLWGLGWFRIFSVRIEFFELLDTLLVLENWRTGCWCGKNHRHPPTLPLGESLYILYSTSWFFQLEDATKAEKCVHCEHFVSFRASRTMGMGTTLVHHILTCWAFCQEHHRLSATFILMFIFIMYQKTKLQVLTMCLHDTNINLIQYMLHLNQPFSWECTKRIFTELQRNICE